MSNLIVDNKIIAELDDDTAATLLSLAAKHQPGRVARSAGIVTALRMTGGNDGSQPLQVTIALEFPSVLA